MMCYGQNENGYPVAHAIDSLGSFRYVLMLALDGDAERISSTEQRHARAFIDGLSGHAFQAGDVPGVSAALDAWGMGLHLRHAAKQLDGER